MSILSFIPFELQVVIVLIALAGGIYLVFVFFGFGTARTAAIWGSAAAAIILFASRAFKKGQSYEIDRSNKAADTAIDKARDARSRAERDSMGDGLRKDDGFQRRD